MAAKSRAPRSSRLTHVDAKQRPTMVNVGAKAVTHRVAEAEAGVLLPAEVARVLTRQRLRTAKGAIIDTAILAAVMAVKRTAEIIPFCHPLPIEHCSVKITRPSAKALRIVCRVETHHKTGVEMEALTGATVAALTIYDMCKALSHDIRISGVRLIHKSGGKRRVGRARTRR
jgi:cyclic pyranopterin monophosphate synthase